MGKYFDYKRRLWDLPDINEVVNLPENYINSKIHDQSSGSATKNYCNFDPTCIMYLMIFFYCGMMK